MTTSVLEPIHVQNMPYHPSDGRDGDFDEADELLMALYEEDPQFIDTLHVENEEEHSSSSSSTMEGCVDDHMSITEPDDLSVGVVSASSGSTTTASSSSSFSLARAASSGSTTTASSSSSFSLARASPMPSCALIRNVLSVEDAAPSMEAVRSMCQVDTACIDSLLSKEMDRMSLKERERILQEVHGVSEAMYESPEIVANRLSELENALRSIESKEAYDRALYLSPEYVQDRKFRLMFLRADEFDVQKAAIRMVKHFEAKKGLFGQGEILGRDIVQSDLDESDMATLESGFLQVLPVRDHAGRAIYCMTPSNRNGHCNAESVARVHFYLTMVAHQDEETQQKGVVVIIHSCGNKKKDAEGLKGLGEMRNFRTAMPERVVAAHWLYDNPEGARDATLCRAMMTGRIRSRFLSHCGEPNDQIFQLQSYGIPAEHMPVRNSAGDFIMAYHLDWIQRQRVRESTLSPVGSYMAMVPRRFDVLFGKGRTTAEHTGNLRAFHIVEMYREKYEQANKYEKTEIAERVVRVIRESYGRFLKQEGGGWVEVDPDQAREKISHYFRRLRSIAPASSSSSTSTTKNGAGSKQTGTNGASAAKKPKKATKRRPSTITKTQTTNDKAGTKNLATTETAISVVTSPRYDGQHLLSTESGKRTKLMAA